MDDLTINSDIIVKKGIVNIRDQPIDRYRLMAGPWRGKNGVVFQAHDTLLDRIIALKIWLKLDPRDNRDKVQQGLDEARKMSRLHTNCVAQIYDGDLVDGKIFYATMEFVNGKTLKEYLPQVPSLGERWIIAYLYIDAIDVTTSPDLAHGDPHHGNVMILWERTKQGSREPRIKLLDFGTSRFRGRSRWRQRHWEKVDETFTKILKPFTSFKKVRKELEPFFTKESSRLSAYKSVLNGVRSEATWPEFMFENDAEASSGLLSLAERRPANQS